MRWHATLAILCCVLSQTSSASASEDTISHIAVLQAGFKESNKATIRLRATEEEACTVTDSTNARKYDLSPLRKESGEDYTAKDEATGNIYKINVCNAIHTETWKVDNAANVGVYRELSDGGQSLGQYTEKPHVSHDVLSLTYRDGSTCPADNAQKMESVIAFVCDHGVFGPGQPEFVSSLADCHFFFVWKTQHACSTSSKGLASGLGVVLTAVLLIVAVYFAGFVLYNRFILKKRGKEQLPPMGPTIVEAWSFIQDMIVIGGVTILDKVKGLLGRSRSGGFQGLPTDER